MKNGANFECLEGVGETRRRKLPFGRNTCQFEPNSNLSTVVRTQNNRCTIIPDKNTRKRITMKLYFGIRALITAAPKIVIITSNIAMLNILYECIPCPGFPNKSLYLQNIFILILSHHYNVVENLDSLLMLNKIDFKTYQKL